MSDAFVRLRDLTLSYGNTVAVPALNLDIREGELIALLGPSGCGKTTTMRAIAGLLSPTSGSIEIDGRDVTRLAANKRGIGLVFQSYALFPHPNAFENVAFGLRLQKLPEAEIRAKTEAGLATVGLTGFEARKPAEINVGEVIRHTEASMSLVECFGDRNACVLTPHCVLRTAFSEALEAFLDVLDSYTLADLISRKRTLRRDLLPVVTDATPRPAK